MNIETVITIIAAFGGIEGIKLAITAFLNRKTDRRREEASVTALEVQNHQTQIDRYEERLRERDRKVDAIYIELRQEQEKNLSLINENNNLQLELKEAAMKRCDIRGCSNRQPPSDY